MKKILSISIVLGILLGVSPVFAAFSDPFKSIQLAPTPSNGNCLTTDGTNNAWGSCGTGGSGSPGGSNTQVQFNDAGGFGGDAGFVYDKTNDLATIVHLLLTGSSTLQAFTFTNATGSKATTTSFAITSILSKLLKTDGNGSVIGAIAGTDYENPLTFSTGLTRTVDTITVDTTQNISTLSNLTSNGFVKTSGGTGALSIDTTTYTPTTRTLTVAGTANQITSSAGAQNLSANRTWTLSLPNHVIFPGNFQATNSTTTNATTTALDVTGTLTFNGVTGSAWSDFCTTITGSASLCDGDDATGSGGAAAVATSSSETSGRVPFWTSTNATPATLSGGVAGFAFDSTLTKLTVTNASTTNLSIGSLSGILKQSNGVVSAAANGTDYTLITGTTCSGNDKVSAISASGSVTCSTDVTGSGGAGLATSTNIADTWVIYGTSASDVGAEAAFTYDDATNVLSVDHYLANSSSTLQNFTFVNATGSAATTTNFFSTIASTSNLYLATGACSGSSAVTINSSGKAVCGTLAPTAGSITGAGDITRTNDTNVTLTLGGTPTGATLNNVSFTLGWTGTLADSRVADNLTISGGTIDNTPIGASTPSTGIFTNATSTTLSTTKASTTDLWVSNVASALVLTDSAGKAGKYAGTSCTNQFPRSLSATGSATCATVANTDLANSSVSYGGVTLSLGGSDASPAFNLADATGLPISTGVSGLGTGVATALGVNVGSAGAFVTFNGALGTPSSGTLTNATGLPISSGVSGLGANIATFLATPSSANLAAALTDETGTGANVFANSPTFTGTAVFAGLTAVDATTTGTFTIPQGASPLLADIGKIAFDTTANQKGQLLVATSTNNSYPAVFPVEQKIWGRTVASTSVDFVSGGRMPMPPLNDGWQITKITCVVDGGTSVVVNFDTLAGGSNTTSSTCGTTKTVTPVTANSTLASSTPYAIEFGTITGSVDYVSVSLWGTPTRE